MSKVEFKFGTDGVRGIIDVDFTEYLVANVVEATYRYWSRRYGVHKAFISYDSRRKSDVYARVAASVLLNHGVDVVMASKPTPTPVAAWYGVKYKFDLIIQITASHNPPRFNGIKVISAIGAPAQEEDTRQIEELYKQEWEDIVKTISTLELKPSVPMVDPAPEYIDYVLDNVTGMFKPKRKFRVLIDPIHGTSIGYTSRILERMGMEVKEIHNTYDSNFGGRDPVPEPPNIPELIEAVVKGEFEIGIAHDGDADRIGLVDKVHGYLSANDILPVVVDKLASIGKVKKGIVRTVSTTHVLDKIAVAYGLKILEVPVGVKYVAKAIIEGQADMGGEESGGLVFSWHIPDKDGIYTASLIIAMASEFGGLTELVNDVRSRFGRAYYKRVDLDMQDSKKFVSEHKDELITGLSRLGPNPRPITIDGVKVVYDDGSWILIRGSGTEPKLRIYSEALDPRRVDELINAALKLVQGLSQRRI